MFASASSSSFFYAAVVIAVSALAAVLYAFGLDAAWMFDDEFSLKGLASVSDLATARDYVLSGTTGPSGRSLALASFLINASAWPNDPSAFRTINISLHVLNGVLVYLTLLSLAKQTRSPRAWQVAVTAAVFWLLSPFLASAVLSVVQRMTLLSGTFTLLGLLVYVRARVRLDSRPYVGLALMSGGLVLFTLLGVLTKESAALLPLFAAVIELCFPAATSSALPRRVWLAWRLVFFLGPLLLICAYAVLSWPGSEITYRTRPFDLSQRLSSQAVILWQYVLHLVIPQPGGFGLFHDDVAPRQLTDPLVWAASCAWLAVIVAAIALRSRLPWLGLAVGGFLAGHLIESTVFPLELYFEHRNYVVAMFVYAGVGAMLWGALEKRLAAFAAIAYAAILALSLANVTTLWGKADVAAEMWFSAHPASPRAAQFVSQQRLRAGFVQGAHEAIRQAYEAAPSASDLMVQNLNFECGVLGVEAMREHSRQVAHRLRDADFSWAAIDAVGSLDQLVAKGECRGLDGGAPLELAEAMLANPRFHASALARDHLHNFLAGKASERGDLFAAERHQVAAYEAAPTVSNAQLVAIRMLQRNDTESAIAFLKEAKSRKKRTWPWTAKQESFAEIDMLIKSLTQTSQRERDR